MKILPTVQNNTQEVSQKKWHRKCGRERSLCPGSCPSQVSRWSLGYELDFIV